MCTKTMTSSEVKVSSTASIGASSFVSTAAQKSLDATQTSAVLSLDSDSKKKQKNPTIVFNFKLKNSQTLVDSFKIEYKDLIGQLDDKSPIKIAVDEDSHDVADTSSSSISFTYEHQMTKLKLDFRIVRFIERLIKHMQRVSSNLKDSRIPVRTDEPVENDVYRMNDIIYAMMFSLLRVNDLYVLVNSMLYFGLRHIEADVHALVAVLTKIPLKTNTLAAYMESLGPEQYIMRYQEDVWKHLLSGIIAAFTKLPAKTYENARKIFEQGTDKEVCELLDSIFDYKMSTEETARATSTPESYRNDTISTTVAADLEKKRQQEAAASTKDEKTSSSAAASASS